MDEEHSHGGVRGVEPFSGEEEGAELGAVEPPSVAGMDLGPPDVLRRVGGDTAVDVGEAVEPADRREARSIVVAASPRSSIART